MNDRQMTLEDVDLGVYFYRKDDAIAKFMDGRDVNVLCFFAF